MTTGEPHLFTDEHQGPENPQTPLAVTHTCLPFYVLINILSLPLMLNIIPDGGRRAFP